MDLQLIRALYYDDWIGETLDFMLKDGRYYSGELAAWYSDGTLVLDNLKIYRSDEYDDADEPIADVEMDYVLINGDEIRYVVSSSVAFIEKGERVHKKQEKYIGKSREATTR